MYPILNRFLLFLVLPILLLIVGQYVYLRSSLAVVQGDETVEGITGSVEITRDAFGVPHIAAENDADAFFSMGYVHAQDRLWQLEVQKRIAAGRLSEIFGKESLGVDQMMRTLGFRRLAQKHYESLSQAAKSSLDAYSAGVNAWVKTDRALPLEFIILGVEPEEWSPIDSLSWLKVISWNLSSNYTTELDRLLLLHELGEEKTRALFMDQGGVSNGLATSFGITEVFAMLGEFSSDFKNSTMTSGHDIGSNAWAVSGQHTKSGLPLLANDPHVQTQIPSLFYLASLTGNKLSSVGATFPGLPFVIFGHNSSISWGGATFAADVQDLYIEQTNPANPNQYFYDESMKDMVVIDETIYIKPEFPGFLRPAVPPQIWKARSTVHGPVISDVLGVSTDQVISLSWPGFNETDLSYEALLNINYADSWEDFTQALKLVTTPTLAFAYADKEDNIGIYVSGKIPIRGSGKGSLPNQGWDADNDWQDYVPFEENPQLLNPSSGYVVLANHKFIDESYSHLVTMDWPESYRAERITQLLNEATSDASRELTVNDMQSIQSDQLSTASLELLPYLLAVEPTTKKANEAIDILRDWNGEFDDSSAGAVIFEMWFVSLRETLLLDDLHGDLLNVKRSDYLQSVVSEIPFAFYKHVLSTSETRWCDNVSTDEIEDCQNASLGALNSAIDRLDKLLGGRMTSWSWGEAHKSYFKHTPFSNVNLLDVIFEEKISSVGNNYTVNLSESDFTVNDGFEQFVGPTYRQIIDMGDLGSSLFSVTPGQSGNILSRHYNDTLAGHQDMKYIHMKSPTDSEVAGSLTLSSQSLRSE